MEIKMFKSAKLVAARLTTSKGHEFIGTLPPPPQRIGPIVIQPAFSDGHVFWPSVWVVAIGQFFFVKNCLCQLRFFFGEKSLEMAISFADEA